MAAIVGSHPVLSCQEAQAFEAGYFGGDEAKEWPAMQRAGAGVARALLRDAQEIGGFPPGGRILVLAGKGHNGGDALIAARALLEAHPEAKAEVVFVFGQRELRPLAARAWQELAHLGRDRVEARAAGDFQADSARRSYAVVLDGVFGFQFRPPVPPDVASLFRHVAGLRVALRAAVDLPSGLVDAAARGVDAFQADFTYATGCVKAPAVNGLNADFVGRLRYIDLGFFGADSPAARLRVLTPDVLAPLASLRRAESDKRTYGHVMILGGSRQYPGASLMTVLGALRSGAGLVTAFVPESLAAAFAARAPEAMWVGLPETPDGGLALEGHGLVREKLGRADALVIGPGMGRERETLALIGEIVATASVPLVLDADALQPEIVRRGTTPRVLTPHLGELRRILEGDDLYASAGGQASVVILKGRLTCVTTDGGRSGYYSPFGGPVLARGGSGDILAGITGTMLAQTPGEPASAACRAVVWQGLAADALARDHGQVAVQATQLLDYLAAALRDSSGPI